MMKYVFGVLALIAIVAAVVIAILKKQEPKERELTQKHFEHYKKKVHRNCNSEEFEEFFAFLKKYPGGYVKRQKGEIVKREYTGREKGDLKGIFYNVIFSNPNISVEDKEEFRIFIVSKGVNGCDERPDYETRDSKLRNRNDNKDEYERKEIGNQGEETVREVLNRLKEKGYLVINGPVLLYDGVKREYDHIVIGENGVFSLETKAFGVSKDGKNKASLFIDKGDKWTLRKNGANRELKSPTLQILSERDHLKNILYNAKEKIEVKPVLVLSNSKLYLKKNIKLDYDVIFVKKLEEYILSAELNRIIPEEQRLIAEILDEHRINA